MCSVLYDDVVMDHFISTQRRIQSFCKICGGELNTVMWSLKTKKELMTFKSVVFTNSH